MAFNQELIMDAMRRNLIVQTSLDLRDVQESYMGSSKDFMIQVHRDIALKVADCVFRQIAPAIDEAMKGLTFTDDIAKPSE
jgi:hypothetical protein